MKRAAGILIGAAAAWAALAGCAGQERASSSHAERGDAFVSGLVLPSTELMELGLSMNGDAWESSRNDAALGVDGYPGRDSLRLLDVRSVDRRWTINGRVRESSHTTTHTRQRAVIRSE